MDSAHRRDKQEDESQSGITAQTQSPGDLDSAHRRDKQEDESQSGITAQTQSPGDFSQQPHEAIQRANQTSHGILHDCLGEHTNIAPPKTTSYPEPSSENSLRQTSLDKDRRSTRRNQDPLSGRFPQETQQAIHNQKQRKKKPTSATTNRDS